MRLRKNRNRRFHFIEDKVHFFFFLKATIVFFFLFPLYFLHQKKTKLKCFCSLHEYEILCLQQKVCLQSPNQTKKKKTNLCFFAFFCGSTPCDVSFSRTKKKWNKKKKLNSANLIGGKSANASFFFFIKNVDPSNLPWKKKDEKNWLFHRRWSQVTKSTTHRELKG